MGEYTYTGGELKVTPQMKEDFNNDGYILVRGLLTAEELKVVRASIEDPEGVTKHAIEFSDGDGKFSKMSLWNNPGNDVTGVVGKCQKVAGVMAELLGGEVYHYHTKLMMKEPFTGGKWNWHQDYGYWYQNGCLFPDMATVFIAIDPSTKSNGCLNVIKGSHRAGRIEHKMVAGQTGADPERVEAMMNFPGMEYKEVEMQPGDALYFHSNLLHTSSQNSSPNRRWAFVCAYNRRSNNPVLIHHHPQYIPLEIVDNGAILNCTNIVDMEGKDFYPPEKGIRWQVLEQQNKIAKN